MTYRAASTAAGSVLSRLLATITLLVLLVAPAVLPAVAAAEPAKRFVAVRIDGVTPDVVNTTSDPMVTVTGTVANTGDRPVRDVVVRLESAAAVTSSSGLRTNLVGDGTQYQPVADFVTVAPELDRGQKVPFTLSYPVRSNEQPALQIKEPGVYPLLVNVNGTPDYGAPARLGDARFLLPVLGVPADPSSETSDSVAAVVPPDTSRPVGVTMLWPLADRPRLAAGVPGATTPVRLIDDELASSLAPGGRLDILLRAADFATSAAVDPTGRVRSALCLAVDPDLLVTVNAMTAGYVVVESPDGGINSPARLGTGQDAAIDWLARLKTLVQRTCVTSSVYAQADLTALARVGDRGLSAIATADAPDIVEKILGVPPVRGATLLADGPLTGPAVELLSAQGPTVAVAAPDFAAQGSGASGATGENSGASGATGGNSGASGATGDVDLTPRRYTPQVVTAPVDRAVGAALAAVGGKPSSPSYLDASLAVPPRQDARVARLQNALGALLWRGLRPEAQPRDEVLMPPMVWDLTAEDAASLLSTLATSILAGLTAPRPLTAVIAQSAAIPQSVDQPLPDDALGNPRARFGENVTSSIAGVTGRLGGLTAALTVDARTGLTGVQYTAPLREDMLRALSQSVPADSRNGLAEQRVSRTGATVNDLFNAVTVVNPGEPYTLATERSPLPLALRNDLPVPIRVRLAVDAPPGMTVTDMGEIELPTGFLPLKVPIEVHFTQRVAVDVSLQTADGLPLGEQVRLSVHSNAYGKVLFFISLSAGTVLVLLAGRRLWHRFHGQPDPADLDRPRDTPDPLDVAIAHAPDDT